MCGGSTNSTRPRACRSISPFLSDLEAVGVELDARLLGPGQQPLEAHQAQAAGQVGELGGREVGEVAELAVLAVEPGGERLARGGVGHRDLERRDVRAADEPLVDLGELVAEQAEGDVAAA